MKNKKKLFTSMMPPKAFTPPVLEKMDTNLNFVTK